MRTFRLELLISVHRDHKLTGCKHSSTAQQALHEEDETQGSYAKEELADLVATDLVVFHKVFAS